MYQFRLQRTVGSSADPPTYRSTVLNWRQGDKIPLTAERTLRVLGVRDDDADQPPALVVEDLPGSATSAAASHLRGLCTPEQLVRGSRYPRFKARG
jgi:hypothetical protein